MCPQIIKLERLWSKEFFSRRRFLGLSAALAAGEAARPGAAQPQPEADRRDFLDVPNPYRLRMHWFIFGPAWTGAECERQLKLMAEAHAGGVLIVPTYPIAVDDPARGIRNQSYLSPEFFSVLNAVAATCRKLGLTMDIELGTGWPYGGPSVKLEDSAKNIRRARIRVAGRAPAPIPPLQEGEKQIAIFYVAAGTLVDLTRTAGKTTVTPPGDRGEIQIFYSAPTRMQVKRASVGAEGLVVDHYSAAALGRFLEAVGDKLAGGVAKGGIRSIFCDSLEVYRSNWTDGFSEIFRRKRGYDLVAHLPALFDNAHPDCRDLRCDFWRTLSDLALEAFLRPLQQWAHRQGVSTQVEAYGTPPVSLASYREVDIPVGEHYEWKEFNTSRWASSGGHLAGKRTILAEAWTWLGMPNRFGDTLEQLKLCSDLHFLSGINALYGVSYAYSPIELGAPGWAPYFGPALNHTSPCWPYFSHLADYINRASFILQQGQPVADIALYLPAEDSMAEAGTGELLLNWAVRDRMSSNGPPPEFSLKNALKYEADVVKTIITNGYAFDGVDTFVFNSGMRAEGGRLRMGDGDYAILALPNLRGIDLDSLRKIAEFVKQGGMLIATRRLPETAYGLRDREQNRAQVRGLVAELFGTVPAGVALYENPYGRGRAVFSRDERANFLNALRRHPPDIAFAEPSEHVGFVHRRTAKRDYYFLANTSEQPQRLEATFRVGHKQAETWDLRSGTVAALAGLEHTREGTRVGVNLGPFESRVILFREGARPPVAARAEPVWEREVRLVPQWRLRFEDSAIPAVVLDELKSWTQIPAARFFSGRGIYEAQFEAPQEQARAWLDLGRVHETAEVWINDRSAGVAWMRPYRLEVTRHLKPGTNRLRVEVTNLLINKVLGMGPMDYSAVYARYGRRFPPGEEWKAIREPFVSGLLGPVRLIFDKTPEGG